MRGLLGIQLARGTDTVKVKRLDDGEVIATSQHYKSKESCKNGIESVKKNAPDAEVVEEEA